MEMEMVIETETEIESVIVSVIVSGVFIYFLVLIFFFQGSEEA